MARLPTGTVTLLFADIEGSAGRLRRLGPAYEGVPTDYRRLPREQEAVAAGFEGADPRDRPGQRPPIPFEPSSGSGPG